MTCTDIYIFYINGGKHNASSRKFLLSILIACRHTNCTQCDRCKEPLVSPLIHSPLAVRFQSCTVAVAEAPAVLTEASCSFPLSIHTSLSCFLIFTDSSTTVIFPCPAAENSLAQRCCRCDVTVISHYVILGYGTARFKA